MQAAYVPVPIFFPKTQKEIAEFNLQMQQNSD